MRDLNVFIVDDDCFCRNMYKQLLSNMGCSQIHLFNNGEECIENMSLQPDLIVIDYNMATMNGIEVVKIIKQVYPHITILMISGQKESKIAAEAIKLGVAAYIKKDGKELELLSIAANKIATRQYIA